MINTRFNKISHEIAIAIFIQLVFFPISVNGQDSLKGQVLDTTKSITPISYASVGIIGVDVGTITNEAGTFQLLISKDHSDDTLTFSKIGYYPKKVKVTDLLIQKEIKIVLVPKIMQLNEVLIVANGAKVKSRGNITRARWAVIKITSAAFGSEWGTVIHFPGKTKAVKTFNFHIISNHPDSAKFRLNVYRFDKTVKENVLNDNIFFTIPGKHTGDFSVNLSNYHLTLKKDVLISVEPVALYTNKTDSIADNKSKGTITISATVSGSESFYRKVSMGKWKKFPYSLSQGFWVTYIN